ncbi:stressosome-associated protein Prli42 [Paenibacillus kobensis]|nr:stressosome-associated protein Prli42 [Paenibacillus kobensis]
MYTNRIVKIVVWLMLAAMLLSVIVSGISWMF